MEKKVIMDERILEQIYETMIYPSEELQNMILVMEKEMKKKRGTMKISDLDREELLDSFLEAEQEIRKAIFGLGVKFGIKLMMECSKE